MRAIVLLPFLLAATGCGRAATNPDPQAMANGVALPAAGTADAVRTAKPGTAPLPAPPPAPSPTASATP